MGSLSPLEDCYRPELVPDDATVKHLVATYAAGAKILFQSLAGQAFQPWPYDFSRKVHSTDSDVRDLHPQPSDDSAFQP